MKYTCKWHMLALYSNVFEAMRLGDLEFRREEIEEAQGFQMFSTKWTPRLASGRSSHR